MLYSGNKKERDEGPFSIELESDKYCPGDTVKGTLIIVANRAFLAQRLQLYVIGYERIVIPKDNTRGEFSKKISYKAEMPPESVAEDSSWDRVITCWLYREDLCSFVPYNPIEIPATTTKKYPFQFTLPKDVLESYSGQNLWIEYEVMAVAKKPWKQDRFARKSFSIFNPYKPQISCNNEDNGIKNNISMISHGSIDGYSKEKTTRILENQQQDQLAKIELDTHTFSPRDTIKGKLYLQTGNCENNRYDKTSNIKSIEISLNAIEHVSTYNNYGLNRDEIYYKNDTIFEKYIEKFELNNDIKNVVPINIKIPEGAKKSYIGKLSKYYWEIQVKLDTVNKRDVHISSIIEIV